MAKKIIHIEELSAQLLLARFDALEDRISDLTKKIPSGSHNVELLTRKEVADLFKVSLVTIHDWTNKGLLKSYRIGNKVRYKEHEIEQALVATQRKR